MKTSIIPWNEFLDELRKQQPGEMKFWLRRWQFGDAGAVPADHRSGHYPFPMLRWLPAVARHSFVRKIVADANGTPAHER